MANAQLGATASPGAAFNPRRLWRKLTFWKNTFLALALAGTGGWLAGFRVPPDPVAEEFLNYLKEDSRRRGESFLKASGYTTNEINPAVGTADLIDLYRWETRRKMQRPFLILLGVSASLAGLVHWMRRYPLAFDASWPKVVDERIPFLIVRWKLRGFDKDGREIVSELYRTAVRARRAAKLYPAASNFRIEQDTSGYEAYEKFKRDLDFLCGSDQTIKRHREWGSKN